MTKSVPLPVMEEVASDTVLQQAYEWLCARRKEYSANNDVWNVRRRWAQIKPQLQAALLAGTYRFRPAHRFCIRGDTIEVWWALDALVLKALALVLTRYLAPRLSPHCYRLVGRGGARAAVRAVAENLERHTFVFRSDVRGYYASIDHHVLHEIVQSHVADPRDLRRLGWFHGWGVAFFSCRRNLFRVGYLL